MRGLVVGAVAVAVLAVGGLAAPGADAVIGGRAAQPGEAPFTVSLQHTNGGHFCGGSVVAASWVLTAAHCVVGEGPASIRAVIGRARLADGGAGQVHAVASVTVHPQYQPATARNDVALVQLATPTTVAPLRLATVDDDALEAGGAQATVYGWGATLVPLPLLGGLLDSPATLQAGDVQLVGDRQCRAAYQLTLTALLPIIGVAPPTPADHVCAAGLLRDSCYGDSGGPLVARTGTGPVQIGVVSTGLLCALPTHPGIYGEVNGTAIRSWITTVAGV